MTMGERIRFYRTKQGLSLEKLGDMLGVQRTAILKYENGSVENIKRSTIKRMAEIFGVSPCYLMWGEESDQPTNITPMPKALTDTERQLLAAFRALNADGQKFVLSTVEMCSNNPSMKKDSENRVG